MHLTFIRLFLIFFCISSLGFERTHRFRIEASRSSSPVGGDPRRPLASIESQPRAEFNFCEHWTKKHTHTVTLYENGRIREEIRETRGSPITARPDHVYYSLHEAAMANDERGIERLLVNFAGLPNAYDNNGQTALQCAVDYACDKAIACLIKHGARADFLNLNGDYTAWTLAQLYSQSTGYINNVPLLALQQALAQKGELAQYRMKKKARDLEQNPTQAKPRKMIRLRRNPPPRERAPELEPEQEPDYDSYLLNV